MFDYVHNNRKLVQLFLALITLPFAFFGIESFVGRSGGADTVAEVGSYKISQQELQNALRDQQERLRQQFGRSLPAAMLDTPELRRGVLDNLINQRLLAQYATQAHLVVGDAQLGEAIQAIPAFQDDGRFSRARYDAYIAGQGMSSQEFERRLRQDMTLQQVLATIQGGALPNNASTQGWLAALQQVRDISEFYLKPEQFTARVKLAADAAKKYYEANPKTFESPERVSTEYLVLSQETLAAQINISDKEVTDWYQAHADRYRQNEERQASHILITAARDADPATLKATQARADDILAKVQHKPADFARLASEFSQDTGSAARGGDLGWFTRGSMVKPFEEAAFALKPGEISKVIRSDFGFHIIRLTGVKAEKERPLAEVRSEIVEELKRQAAAKKYAEFAESFTNTVYEQSDSLKPAAEKFQLQIQEGPWLDRKGGAGQWSNTRLIESLFSDDVLKNKRNTEAIEVAPNTLLAARVKEHKPVEKLPFEGARPAIEQRLIRDEAAKLTQKEGEAQLARLSKGEPVDVAWGPERGVSRMNKATAGLGEEAMRVVFKADTTKLPAYAGTILPDGAYALFRINRLEASTANAANTNAPRLQKLQQEYASTVASEDAEAWLNTLKQKFPAKINKAALENKEKP